jgi:hypothetical protein
MHAPTTRWPPSPTPTCTSTNYQCPATHSIPCAPHSFPPGGPDSCQVGTFVVASTAPGMQAALSSPNEAYVLALSPSGQLTLNERATGRVLLNSRPSGGCLPPYQLVLKPNGLLMLTDRRGSVMWASGNACAGNNSCYSYALQNDGQLVIKDGNGVQVWSSTNAGAAAARGQLQQIISGGVMGVSCIHSGPNPAASHLLSASGQYKLILQQQGAQLQLLENGTSTQLWSPPGALPGQAPARLCISSQGSLDLSWGIGQQLWSSGPAGSDGAGPYVGLVAADGCLLVLDGTCSESWSSHYGVNSRKAPPPRLSSTASRPPRRQAASQPPSTTGTHNGSQQRRPPPGRPRGMLRTPPPRKSTSLLVQPPGSRSGRLPPPGNSASRLAPPLSSSRAMPPPAHSSPAAQLVKVPVRKPPPSRPAPKAAVAASGKALATCLMPRGQVCGGVVMCGIDGVCLHMGCCRPKLACTRRTEFIWMCADQSL